MLMTRVIDGARTAYVGLPAGIRRSIGPILSRLPVRYRYGKTYLFWREKIARARRNPELLPGIQKESMTRILMLAYKKSPYYREILSAILQNGDVESLVGTDLWYRIPVIGSNDVRRESKRMCTRPHSELDVGSTGGSSGQPLTFYIDRDRSPIEYAFVMDAWHSVSLTEHDWQAVFRSFQIPDPEKTPFEVESGLRELRFSVFHMTPALMPRYLEEIARRGIRFLKGYPSALAVLASHAIRSGTANPHIRGVMLHSEYLHAGYRDLIVRAFPNARLVSFYGMSEKCAFAVEDPCKPSSYHFNPLYGYTELLDDDNQPITTPRKRGRIVSTGLLFPGMPFIRYDTGDEAVLGEPASEKNGWQLRLDDVRPRFTDEFVVTLSGNLIHVSAMFMVDDEFEHITDLQFEQFEPGVLHMKCALTVDTDRTQIEKFRELVARGTDGDLELVVTVVDSIPLSPRGKRPIILQHLNTDLFCPDLAPKRLYPLGRQHDYNTALFAGDE